MSRDTDSKDPVLESAPSSGSGGFDGEEAAQEQVGLKASRLLEGKLVSGVFTGLAAAFSLTYIYFAIFGYPSPQLSRGLYIAFVFVLGFILFPASRRSPMTRPSPLDWVLAAAGAFCCYYFITMYEQIVFRGAVVNTFDVVVSAVGILLCLELTRRVVGNFLVGLAVVFLVYSFVGPHIPGLLAHRGYSLSRIVTFQWLTVYGVFGTVTSIFANFVFLFVILGTVLDKFGAGKFFLEFPYSLVGATRGGPAKAAVLVSGLIGSITGSAAANVTTTGTFTIPLMKRTGYKPHVAGAVEASASTGGQMMPPIMGAGAFLISEFTGLPYVTIVLVSIGPAILYYASLLWLVHLEAVKEGLRGMKKDDLPRVGQVLRRGWFYATPFAVIFALLLLGFSPGYSAFWAIVSIVAIGMVNPATRIGPAEFVDMLASAAKRSLLIGALAGSIGLVIGAVQLTGLGLKISEFIVDLSGGILPLAIVLVGVASYVLGMGLTVTSAYITLAVLAVPALIQLGVPLLAAHLVVFWFSQAANVTPPVCLAAFAAAGIAGASPMKTGWHSTMFARAIFVMPFVFVYIPAFILAASLGEILLHYLAVGVGLIALGNALKGFFLTRLLWWERLLALLATGLLFSSSLYIAAGGLLLFTLLWANQRYVRLPGEAGGGLVRQT